MAKKMDMAPGARLRQARLAANFRSARAAARHYRWPISSYAAHENGSRGFYEDDAKRYGKAFKVNYLWLLHDVDEPEVRRVVPVGQEFPPDPDPDEPATVGSETGLRGIPSGSSPQVDVTGGMGAGGVTIVREGVAGKNGLTFAAEHIADYWRLPMAILGSMGARPQDIAIIPVQGDSMSGTLLEGDCVFIDTRHRLPSPDGVYALGDEFGGIVVKRLEVVSGPRDEEAMIRIISDNPRHAPKERLLSEMHIIGRVLRKFGVVG